MTSNFKFTAYDTVKIRAEFTEHKGCQWVNIYFTGNDGVEVSVGTMFFDNRAVAEAYAKAINSVDVNAPPVVVEERAA